MIITVHHEILYSSRKHNVRLMVSFYCIDYAVIGDLRDAVYSRVS